MKWKHGSRTGRKPRSEASFMATHSVMRTGRIPVTHWVAVVLVML